MLIDLCFHLVQSINHNGTVIVFGESKDNPEDPKDPKNPQRKLWYKVLDLEQVEGSLVTEGKPEVRHDTALVILAKYRGKEAALRYMEAAFERKPGLRAWEDAWTSWLESA